MLDRFYSFVATMLTGIDPTNGSVNIFDGLTWLTVRSRFACMFMDCCRVIAIVMILALMAFVIYLTVASFYEEKNSSKIES